jgi:ribose-phosphate pyrophosphokinase
MNIQKYPDGSSYSEVKQTDNNNFGFKINTYEDLWHLNQIVDGFNNLNITPTITIPNLIDAQADRRFNKGESSGLKLVCNFLNNLNANFIIFHPHNAEVVEALVDNVEIVDNSEFITTVLSKLNDKDITPVILLPDGGAYKWGVKLMDKIGFKGDVLACAKNRKFVDGKSVLKQELPNFDFKNKDVLIIDDICVNGGTFLGLSSLLKESCKSLNLAISHLTVKTPNKNLESAFDTIFTTNSKFEYNEYKLNNLKIINLF